MPKTSKELREQRAPIREKLLTIRNKIAEEGRAMTDEERTQFTELDKQFNDLTSAITDADAFDKYDADDRRSDKKTGRGDIDPREERQQRQEQRREESTKITDEDRTVALQAWVRKANGLDLRKSHRDACRRTGLNPNAKSIDIKLPHYRNGKPDLEGYAREARDMSVADPTKGGYTVAPEFVALLEKAMLAYNGVREVASVMRTSTGAPMPWPTINDTGNSGERIDENTAASSQDASVGSVTFGAYKYSSKLIPVSYELLNDSAFNLAAEIFPMLGERIGRVQAVDFTTGTGSNQPQGAMTGASEGVDAAGTSLTIDDLLNLIRSVDPAYRNDPSTAFMCHDTILGKLLQLKDLQGLPYLLEGYRNGERTVTLQGFPFKINQAMASSMANTNKTVLFGTWSKYKIRDVASIRLRRLDERYAEKDQVGFLAFMRSDGRMLNAGTNPLKYLIHTT